MDRPTGFTYEKQQEHLDALLLGLCLERPHPSPHSTCEWTDLTLPVLIAILLLAPPLQDATVLALLERIEGAVAVRTLSYHPLLGSTLK